jgi:hypothetical protein
MKLNMHKDLFYKFIKVYKLLKNQNQLERILCYQK